MPLGVSGALLVNILCDTPEILTDANLSAWSNIASNGNQVQISSTGNYELKGLAPSGDFRLEVTGADDVFRFTEDAVPVLAGKKETVNLSVPSPSIFHVKVVDENSDPVQGVSIEFYDDFGSFMGNYFTNKIGLTPLQMTYASQVRAKLNVGNRFYYNHECNCSVA